MVTDSLKVHPLLVRITHWVNALAIVVMVLSGWKIYNASPLFDFSFPDDLTLGGWLAGALQWHFAAMWILVLNGMIYLAYGLFSGHLWRRMFPLSPGAMIDQRRRRPTSAPSCWRSGWCSRAWRSGSRCSSTGSRP